VKVRAERCENRRGQVKSSYSDSEALGFSLRASRWAKLGFAYCRFGLCYVHSLPYRHSGGGRVKVVVVGRRNPVPDPSLSSSRMIMNYFEGTT
jgi:hypothetical protein